MPTCARNNAKPNSRNTREAAIGILHVNFHVLRALPRYNATSSKPAKPSFTLPKPGMGKAIEPTAKPNAAPTPIER